VITGSRRLLGGGIAMLALLLALEWLLPSGSGAALPRLPLRLGPGPQKTPLVARATAEWTNSILARPLFSSNRKPPRNIPKTGNMTAPEDARLAGILIGRFGRRAIFAPAGGGKPLVLGENGAVNDSTIRSIEPSQVVLANGTVLRPSFDRNRVPTTYTPPFPSPNFPNQIQPGTPIGGNGVQPNFPLPRFPQPVPQPQVVPGNDGETDNQQPQPPAFRGPMIPNRRE
jgi:hypothetical protein